MTLPLVIEIAWTEPALVAAALAEQPYLAWLDSGGAADGRGRYSYIACQPFQLLTDAGTADPFAALQAELARWRLPAGVAPVPFAGGAIGFIGYGMAAHLERLTLHHPPAAGHGMMMALHDVVLGFDRLARRVWVISSGFPASGAAQAARAQTRAAAIIAALATPPQPIQPAPSVCWTADLTAAQYQARIAAVLRYIQAGDIFQANFTTAFRATRPAGLSPFAIHSALREANPAPFGAFLDCGDGFALASMSPERFISLDAAGGIETRPIKGTSPRGNAPAADAALRQALQTSAKDHAENLMIVDLMRSDIGRAAVIGSVRVAELARLESFASVHHLVSVVTAQLAPGLGAVDLLRAAFPGGSVTGAPKLRAMAIIDELEASARGAYCGSIGWIGFDGAMDSSITIRTVAITPAQLVAQAGGGIVADSDPAAEYAEMLVKIRPLLQTFGAVQR